MFIIHGVYHFWPKRVAFRNDFCLSCEAPRRAIATRTFDVGHVFWIPILPVGLWKHWTCSVCRRHPHQNPKTRRSFKWLALFVLIIVAAAAWGIPLDPDLEIGTWIVRIGAPVGALVVLANLRRTRGEPSLRERLSTIPPADEVICPFCAYPLVAGTGTRWSCSDCGAMRY
jgi:hypothetical protein